MMEGMIPTMEKRIKELAKKYLPMMQEIRRDLHTHPELAYNEYRTSKVVQAILTKLGIEHQVVFNTGVLGLIHGTKPLADGQQPHVLLLRADMDALPIQENVDIPFKSTVENVMHACGHDGHTAGLLGAAMILTELRDTFSGTIKLMFQPAEETEGGARQMIEEGILENPTVEAGFGIHLYGGAKLGEVGVKSGALYGAPDEFEIKIIGSGGHAAEPEKAIDPVNIAVQFMSNAQNILTRRINPMHPAVISFCSVHAGSGLNVIPDDAYVGGTIRTLNPDTRQAIPQLMEQMLADVCHANNATYEFNYYPSYPPLINDEQMTNFARTSIAKIVGEKNVLEIAEANLGAEDFSYVCEAIPASYYLVGIGEEGKPEPIFHHSSFAWNDEVLAISAATFAQIAYDFLNQTEN